MQPRVRTCFCDFSLNWIIRRSHLRVDVLDSQTSTSTMYAEQDCKLVHARKVSASKTFVFANMLCALENR